MQVLNVSGLFYYNWGNQMCTVLYDLTGFTFVLMGAKITDKDPHVYKMCVQRELVMVTL